KSARHAPFAATSAAMPSILSIVAARSKTTDSAWTHATFTVSSIGSSLGRERAHELVLGLVVELHVLRTARHHLLPVTVARGLDQPLHLPRNCLGPGDRGRVAEVVLRLRHVDEQRFRNRPRRRADLAEV